MKLGKFIRMGEYNNVKLGYGTVDFKNLKTIYIKLNSWVEPSSVDVDFDSVIRFSRKKIKDRIRSLKNPNFKEQSIVDIDIRTNGIKLNKRSFMNLEITLYVDRPFEIKSKEVKTHIKKLAEKLIDDDLADKNLFNFYNKKN